MWMIKRLFVLGLLLATVYRIDNLERELARVKSKQPVIIYQVDNAGGVMVGKITDKEIKQKDERLWQFAKEAEE